jgi:ABC-type amino acid transport substrate-binding protein
MTGLCAMRCYALSNLIVVLLAGVFVYSGGAAARAWRTRHQLRAARSLLATPMLGERARKAEPPWKVGAALPDPPFEVMTKWGPAGFDFSLVQRIAEKLGRKWQLVRYTGADFNGIFAGLASGAYDCVASGTTITKGREMIADFCAPYAVSGQSLVVDTSRHPDVHGINDLKGLVLAFMKLAPVMERFVRDRPKLAVVETRITRERLGISVRQAIWRYATRSMQRKRR